MRRLAGGLGRPRRSKYGFDLALQCRALSLPEPVCEFRFHLVRKWRFDFAWPAHMIALEREGVVYKRGSHELGGRHVSAKGFRDDTEKYGEATAMGWRILRCLPDQIDDGTAVRWVERMLKFEGLVHD